MIEILYSQTQEFVYKHNDSCFIGITEDLLKKLGTVIFLELPAIGEYYTKGEIFGFLESQESATEVFMPISGTILAVNENIKSTPENLTNLLIESSWLIKISSEFYNEDKKDLICYNKVEEF